MKKKPLLIALGVVALALIVFLSQRASSRRDTVKVYAEKVARRDITQVVEASGQIHPRIKVNISAHVIGKIARLYVQEGDWIESGAPFLELEREAFVASRDDAKARLAMADTQRRQADVSLSDAAVKLERAQRLANEGISAKEALEAAQLQSASAELQVRSSREGVAQAKAFLDKAEDDLRKTTIYSPLTGRVIALNAEQGEVVVSGTMNNPASVIGTVADLSEILAEVDVDETEIVEVRVDLPVEVAVDAMPDVSFPGRVVEVGSSGYTKPQQPDVQFFKVKVLLDLPDPRLRPGMSARAKIRIATHPQVLVVPIQAVVERSVESNASESSASDSESGEEAPVAFVVDGKRASRKAVETGISDATHVEVTSGLTEGEQVITGPYRALKKLEDGDPIEVQSEKDLATEKDDDKKGD